MGKFEFFRCSFSFLILKRNGLGKFDWVRAEYDDEVLCQLRDWNFHIFVENDIHRFQIPVDCRRTIAQAQIT